MKLHQCFKLRHLTELQTIRFICFQGELCLPKAPPTTFFFKYSIFKNFATSKVLFPTVPNCGLLEVNLSGCVGVNPKKWFYAKNDTQECLLNITFAFILCLIILCLIHFPPFWGEWEDLREYNIYFWNPYVKKGYIFMHNEFSPLAGSQRYVCILRKKWM